MTFKELNNYLLKQIDENDNLNYDCIFVVAANGWGLQNIEKFMKAKNFFYKDEYVILLIEENFTRGLRRIHSYFALSQKKPFFALNEI